MARPPHNVEPPDEQGKLLLFPDVWVPPDGVQPLNGSGAGVDAANDESGDHELDGRDTSQSERSAFEAGEFWERGDTQEFVGVATGAPVTSTSNGHVEQVGSQEGAAALAVDRLAKGTNGGPTASNGAGITERSRARPHVLPRLAAIAVLVIAGGVSGGIAIATGSGSHAPSRGSLTAARPLAHAGSASSTHEEGVPPALINPRHAKPKATAHRSPGTRVRRGSATHISHARANVAAGSSVLTQQQSSSASTSASSTPVSTSTSSAQTAQSGSRNTTPAAHPGPYGPLTCVQNC